MSDSIEHCLFLVKSDTRTNPHGSFDMFEFLGHPRLELSETDQFAGLELRYTKHYKIRHIVSGASSFSILYKFNHIPIRIFHESYSFD